MHDDACPVRRGEEPFMVDGEELMYPLDPNGSAARHEAQQQRERMDWPGHPPAVLGSPRPAPDAPRQHPRRPALVTRHRSRQVRLLHRCRLGRSA